LKTIQKNSRIENLTKVKFTNLNKILFPELKISKIQVLEYYLKIISKILNFLKGRAVVRVRYPDGIDKGGFYEKNAPEGVPDWVKPLFICQVEYQNITRDGKLRAP
jgi:DNA primase